MKRWIDRPWAKVTAFCLLVLSTVLLAVATALIAYLADRNVYLDGGERLGAEIYGRVCYDQRAAAEDYIFDLTGGAVFSERHMYAATEETEDSALDVQALAVPFRADFADAPCSLCLYDMDGALLLANYTVDSSRYLSEDYLYTSAEDAANDVPAYRLTAALPSDYQPSSYEQLLLDRAVRWRHGIIALDAFFLAVWLLCLIFTLASAGHWQGHEGIHLTWFDKLPADLWLLVFLLFAAVNDYRFYPPALAVALLIFYLFLPAFTAQCKAGTVLKGTAVAWLLRLIRRFFRWVAYVLRRIPLAWRTALAVAALLLFDTLCVMNFRSVEIMALLLFVNLLAGLFLIYLSIGLRALQKGGEALARGDYDHQVDTRWLFGSFRRHGENLNAAQEGMRKTVEQRTRSERMKTELITNVSHDIKTPLTSIVNYVDLLKKEPIDNPAAAEYIEVLDRQSRRLKKLTEDLVEASKAASGAIPVTLTDTDVNVFLSQVAGEYRQRLSECQIEPVLTLDESAPRIRADGKLLWRVLDNLMGNVCKYAMPGTRVYLSSARREGQVLLTFKNVSRYPLNISADELTERFVRGDASRSTEGSGLGLSIAAGLTRLQKGEFHLDVDGDLFKAQLTFAAI